jgi:hypothetical protein
MWQESTRIVEVRFCGIAIPYTLGHEKFWPLTRNLSIPCFDIGCRRGLILMYLYFVGILISGKYNSESMDIVQRRRIDTGTLERSETRGAYAFQDHL